MAKRKPGGGRKSMAGPTVSLTVRIPADMRALLERGAKKHRPYAWSISQELIARLRQAFAEDRKHGRDPALSMLLYLIARLAERITGADFASHPEFKAEERKNWRTDPFSFRAFKFAVKKLLDSLEEPPEVPVVPTKKELEGLLDSLDMSPELKELLIKMRTSPEAKGDYELSNLLAIANRGPFTEGGHQDVLDMFQTHPQLERDFYGLPQALKALQLPKQTQSPERKRRWQR